jgi:hypothetical protein
MKLYRLRCKIRYYWRKLLKLVGICPRCACDLQPLPNGQSYCPNCGYRV